VLPGLQIVDRYIGRQVFLATLIGVVVLSFVLVLGNLFKDVFELLVDKHLPLGAVLQFVAYILPFSLIFTIPWGLLTAVLLVFGRLSADNELVSLRMAGMSLWRICVPVFLIALGLASLSLWINTSIAPRSQAKMKGAMYDMVTENPASLFVANEPITDFPGYEIFAKQREGNVLKDVTIVKLNDLKYAEITNHAKSAVIGYDEAAGVLELELIEANQIFRNMSDVKDIEAYTAGHRWGTLNVEIDLTELRDKARRVSPSTLPSHELARRIAEDETLSRKKKSVMRTEIHKRVSFSMACITFVLIGIPLGVTAQRRETSVGFLLSLAIAIVYFLFIIIADTFRGKPDAMPHLLMWLPNIVFIGLGLFLFFRLSRK
jgi:lipopolysaccharide export LptBFGC system permease protein LptF